MEPRDDNILYPYTLNHKPRFFLGWALYRLFNRVDLDENMHETLKKMQMEGTVVYAIKYRGLLDYLLQHYSFRRRHLPYPRIAFDLNLSMLLPFGQFVKTVFSHFAYASRHRKFPSPYETGFYQRAIHKGIPSLISLIDPKGFTQQFVYSEKDHLQFLLETQKDMDRPIFILPQLIIYQRTPEKEDPGLRNILFGFRDNPGFIRKTALFFRYQRRAIFDFGQPLDLKAFLQTQPAARPIHDMAKEIRKILIENIDSQKRVILGPIMKSRQQLKEMVLTDKRVSEKIEATANSSGKKLRQVRKKAEEFFNEIAADYSSTYVELIRIALKWLWKRMFEGIEVDTASLAKVREWARKGPLIYVPSHKSHIDYLILNDILHEHKMHIPRIAAGRNLAFWPMGYIFRKAGAFFIRRTFKQSLYVEVFNRYIRVLLGEGHPIEFFIEGGRSRNGKLVLPKTGFLSILLQAHEDGACDDLIFVPASIAYDRILEEKAYIKEIEGGKKEQESLKQVFGARKFLKKNYGKIYLRFNEPFSLNEYLAASKVSRREAERKLALFLIESINQVTPVSPLSLIATAILGYHRKGFLYSELAETTETLLALLRKYHVPLVNSLNDVSSVVQETLTLLINWKVVETLEGADGDEETFYFVEDEKKIELEYYKNSILHYFLHHALVAASLLAGKEEIKSFDSVSSDYEFMRQLFRSEFVFGEEVDGAKNVIGSIIEDFRRGGYLFYSSDSGGFTITKHGFDKLPVWANLIKTFLESYWITAKCIGQQKNMGLLKEQLLKKTNYLGKRYYRLGVVDHIGALSRLNFANAVGVMTKEVSKPGSGSEFDRGAAAEKLSEMARRIYDLSRHGQ
jgi:glycerol-3-phosphate O-acyltransferase